MIIEKVDVNVEKSSNFESTDFRIDAKYKNKVLWMLINQYRHKVRTPVQEIISNARDAQRENGNPDRAIKIQLPTKIEPTFIVRDYGIGMDENRIKTIFTSFGASTKNDDNSQTGGFGIGAKSPLTYTNSFNIKTYVDGRYWFYVITKTKDDGIGINLMSTGKTTKENGTEVQIPVKPDDSRKFVEAACRCTMFWDNQPQFNLMDEDLYSANEGVKISERFTVYDTKNLGSLFNNNLIIIVDGIPYEVDNSYIRTIEALRDIKGFLNWETKGVFKLNTGDIDLLQTRESIKDTDKTTLRLIQLAQNGLMDIKAHLESCFTENTLTGRIAQYKNMSSKFSNIRSHTFENFKITNNCLYLDNDLTSVSYDLIGKSGTTVMTPQRHMSPVNMSFRLTDVGHFYYDDIGENETDTIKNRRMRNHLTVNGEKSIVIRQGTATNFNYMRTIRLLKVRKLSSLTLPEKAVRVKGTKRVIKKLPNEVSPYLYSGGYMSWESCHTSNSRSVSLINLSTKYTYVEFSKSNTFLQSAKFIQLLKDNYDVIPCKMTIKDIKVIKDNKNFIHIDEFMKSFKPTNNMIESVIYEKATTNYIKEAKLIISSEKKIFDKLLIKMAHCVMMKKEYDFRMPKWLVDDILEENKTIIRNKITLIKNFENRLQEKYPMLDARYTRKENVNYINSRRK